MGTGKIFAKLMSFVVLFGNWLVFQTFLLGVGAWISVMSHSDNKMTATIPFQSSIPIEMIDTSK